jgi:N-formylglutamate amidohydrolase
MNLEKYIKFEKGTIPLIFSVPHGGTLECENIPKRLNGILGIDKNTIELTQKLIYYIKKISEKKISKEINPSYIISNVPRNKIDLNREENKAFFQNSLLAQKVYQFYHEKIKEIILQNIKSFNHSLLIDIHGFESNKRPTGFRDVDLILGTNNLGTLFSKPIPKKLWGNTFRGKIIKRFLELNVPIAPGHPRRREYILKGGYITQAYGPSKISKSKTMQIELSDRIRILDKRLKKTIVQTLAEIIVEEFG